jgi:hypothetical protein
MKPNDIAIDTHSDTRIGIGWRNAYHQAGHAAAIYLVNKQKQLPDVPFQIVIEPQGAAKQQADRYAGLYSKYAAKVEGGRLIQHLPASYAQATQALSRFQETEFRCAFESDVINLLAGPLAEAKYLSLRDGEPFNANLVNLDALHFYGGSPDIELANGYMECFIPKYSERTQKLEELFLAAFNFVNERPTWLKITGLADFIRNQTIGTIPYGVLAPLLGERLTEPHKRQFTAETTITV